MFEITLHVQLPISISEVAYTQQKKAAVAFLCAPTWTQSWQGGYRGYFTCKCCVAVLEFLISRVCFFCYCCSLGGILPAYESPEQSRGLENATRACIHKVVSSKWAKYQFWVNYPLRWSCCQNPPPLDEGTLPLPLNGAPAVLACLCCHWPWALRAPWIYSPLLANCCWW